MTKRGPKGFLSFEEWTAQREYAAGNPDALETLWKLHAKWLGFYARFYLRDDLHAAEDALGELGLKLSRPEVMLSYRPTESWKYWVRTILRNITRDMLRKKCRPAFQVTKTTLSKLADNGVCERVIGKLLPMIDQHFWEDWTFRDEVVRHLTPAEFKDVWPALKESARSRFAQPRCLHENQQLMETTASPAEQVEWGEFMAHFQLVLEELPVDLRAIFIMHINLGWSFIRIADVLHGERNANLVSRPYYKAKAMLRDRLTTLGHGNNLTVYSKIQTTA